MRTAYRIAFRTAMREAMHVRNGRTDVRRPPKTRAEIVAFQNARDEGRAPREMESTPTPDPALHEHALAHAVLPIAARARSAPRWLAACRGKAWCLFDTHIGWPQRMWGRKADGTTKGRVRSFASLTEVPLPLHLADIDGPIDCPHRDVNECGQCTHCGAPDAGERSERPACARRSTP